jgi:CTP synthase (UTP-ammonia lyase)
MTTAPRVRIGLIGDYSPSVVAHQAIPRALGLASEAVGCSVDVEWLHTAALDNSSDRSLGEFHGLWCTPASPYTSMSGALRGIRYAREQGIPFLGTCGGFQHALIEYARNVLGLAEADHAESNPSAAMPLIAPLTCSLVGTTGRIHFVPGTRIAHIYGSADAVEAYHCNYGFNPQHALLFANTRFIVSARDDSGEPRAMELTDSDFFIGTLFQPERSALSDRSHPLVEEFLRVAGRA